MKKISILFLTILILTSLVLKEGLAFAATPKPTETEEIIITPKKTTPTPSEKINPSTPSADIDKIERIKEMVASRVAELKLVEKKGLLGIVKETSGTQITIEDFNKNIRTIDIDELTKFEGDTKTFGISDIKSGDMLSFVGIYNKSTKRLLARAIAQKKSLPIQFEGVVADTDIKAHQLKVVDEKGNIKTIDVETVTKTQSYDKTDGFTKSGFSKIEVDQRILVTGFYDLKDKDIIVAGRIVHFLELPASESMKKFQSVVDTEAPVSSGSGKKLTPITR